jgi:hypothetical protein
MKSRAMSVIAIKIRVSELPSALRSTQVDISHAKRSYRWDE